MVFVSEVLNVGRYCVCVTSGSYLLVVLEVGIWQPAVNTLLGNLLTYRYVWYNTTNVNLKMYPAEE